MKLELNSIIDKHKDIPALVLGHGISLNRIVPHLQEYKDRGFIIFDCNEFMCYHKVTPNYWCIANTSITMEKWKDKINSYADKGLTVIYGESIDLSDRKWVEENIKTDYLPYDQRHINSSRCGQGGLGGGKSTNRKSCCDHIIQGRLTIQEELAKYTGVQRLYSGGDTVTLHMLSFAIIMGCNPIYVCGFDLDYHSGYANHPYGDIPFLDEYDVLDKVLPRLQQDICIIKEHALRMNRNIINLNPHSWFKIFQIQEELP